jgi:hypothetical protein
MCEIVVDADERTLGLYRNRLRQNYAAAPFFAEYFPPVERVIAGAAGRLVATNLALMRLAFDALGVSTPTVLASALPPSGGSGPTDLLVDICRAVGATTYLSGVSGRDYLDRTRFAAAGIAVEFQEFHHPVYAQLHEPFEPCMSVLDLLFTHGPLSGAILRDPSERLTELFT